MLMMDGRFGKALKHLITTCSLQKAPNLYPPIISNGLIGKFSKCAYLSLAKCSLATAVWIELGDNGFKSKDNKCTDLWKDDDDGDDDNDRPQSESMSREEAAIRGITPPLLLATSSQWGCDQCVELPSQYPSSIHPSSSYSIPVHPCLSQIQYPSQFPLQSCLRHLHSETTRLWSVWRGCVEDTIPVSNPVSIPVSIPASSSVSIQYPSQHPLSIQRIHLSILPNPFESILVLVSIPVHPSSSIHNSIHWYGYVEVTIQVSSPESIHYPVWYPPSIHPESIPVPASLGVSTPVLLVTSSQWDQRFSVITGVVGTWRIPSQYPS